jgi:hypothetical protein
MKLRYLLFVVPGMISIVLGAAIPYTLGISSAQSANGQRQI